MGATALLISNDLEVQSVVPAILAELSIETKLFTDVSFAKEALRRGSFVGLVVDRDLEDADSLLERGDSPSNQDTISFAISGPGKSKEKCKAAFELFKPLRVQVARVTMRAASGAMVSLYRRSFRCQLAVPISVSNADRTFSAKTLNISIRGIAIETPEELAPEEQFEIDFVYPMV